MARAGRPFYGFGALPAFLAPSPALQGRVGEGSLLILKLKGEPPPSLPLRAGGGEKASWLRQMRVTAETQAGFAAAHAQPGRRTERQREPVGLVAAGQAVDHRDAAHGANLREAVLQAVAIVVGAGPAVAEIAQQQRALPPQHAAKMQLVKQALDPERRLAHVLHEQNAALDGGEIRRAD